MDTVLKIKKLSEEAIIPVRQHDGDAGMDICSIEDTIISPNTTKLVKTGLSMEIPYGYEIQVRSRSGLAAKKSVFVLNSPGTIDCVTADTQILTTDGYMSAKEIFESENKINLISFNEKEKIFENDIVSDSWIVNDKELVELVMENNVKIKLPIEKEVYTEEGWKHVFELNINDKILSYE